MTAGDHVTKSVFTFLPIIPMNPSSYTCLYSTLTFIKEQYRKIDIITLSVTFDQPLWLKATEIVLDKSMDIVVHLGGFHTLMSYLGSVGSVMDGSGLKEVLQTVYGENAVKHMLGGKAIARAVRGHILVESALNQKLLKMIFDNSSVNNYSTMTKLAQGLGMGAFSGTKYTYVGTVWN